MGDYCEIGLLLSYEAVFDVSVLNVEISRFQNIANHQLKSMVIKDRPINFPSYYVNIEDSEVMRDFSMGYYNALGFRTGTFTPHLFYDLNLEQASPVEIHPYYISSQVLESTSEDKLREKLSLINFYSLKCNILLNNSDFTTDVRKEGILKKISILKECLQTT